MTIDSRGSFWETSEQESRRKVESQRTIQQRREAQLRKDHIPRRRRIYSARSTRSKLEPPAKQEPPRSYKKARDVSQQSPSTRRWKERIVLRKEPANQESLTHRNHKRKQLSTRRQSNQPSKSASWSKRRIIVLPERTGKLGLQHEKRVNMASQPTNESRSRNTRQIERITIAWPPSTNNQSQLPRRFNSPARKKRQI